MKTEFAPLLDLLQRGLQMASLVFINFCLGIVVPCCTAIFIGLFFTPFWWISALYVLYWALDWETPRKGGTRIHWFRKLALWQYLKDYFPATLVKTGELDPSKNYIFGLHPHGIFALSHSLCFGTEATGFSNIFPGLTPYTAGLNLLFRIPFYRDGIKSTGAISCDKASISCVLSKPEGGNIVSLVPGGIEEALESRPGDFILVLKKRKGFIRLAITHGVSLVPVFCFGENDLFDQFENPKGSWLRSVQEWFKNVTSTSPAIFYGRGIFPNTIGTFPYRRPLHTVVGKPIEVKQNLHPTKEEVDEVHRIYMEELCKLFEAHKLKYHVPEDKHLTLI